MLNLKSNIMKGWKTILFNAALAILGVLETTDWVNIIPQGWVGIVMIAIGAIGIWLRGKTTTPVGRADTVDPTKPGGPKT